MTKQKTKYIITGSRYATDEDYIHSILNYHLSGQPPESVLIIHGGCRGADQIADKYARSAGIEVKQYKPEWNIYGRKAGPIRNSMMLGENKEARVIAFLRPESRGTQDCINKANILGMRVDVYEVS